MTPNLSEVNSKLKTERRAKQAVTHGQVECAKLSKQVSKLAAKIDQLATGLKEAKAASAKMLPIKQSKPADKKRFSYRRRVSEYRETLYCEEGTQKDLVSCSLVDAFGAAPA